MFVLSLPKLRLGTLTLNTYQVVRASASTASSARTTAIGRDGTVRKPCRISICNCVCPPIRPMSSRGAGRCPHAMGACHSPTAGKRPVRVPVQVPLFRSSIPRKPMPSGSLPEIDVRLSPREREVAAMVAEGLTNREIAARLFISERTADGHLEHIREKLGVNTRAQVTAWVVRREAVDLALPIATALRVQEPRWTMAHPRAWLAAALVLALLASGAALMRLTDPSPRLIRTIVGTECAHQVDPGGCFEADTQNALDAKLSRPMSV